ncbi:MAG TPA: universal stress protein UspA [Bacteroidales bacterium]|jgi:nucleotide-binding universal stress UspA family protein|nr:universal stress protein UspA [Bacteroidales bacterium]
MEDKLITIAIHNYARAEILRTRLEAEGVECYLKNINLIHSVISGGVKVRVSSRDLEKALRIVEKVSDHFRDEYQDELSTADRSVQRILVPIDFSDYSVNACRYAIGLAEKLNAEIKLMHVYYNPVVNSMPLTDTYYYQVNMDEIIREIEIRAKTNMEEFYKDLKDKIEKDKIEGVKLDYSLKRGIASEEIIEESRDYKPDVIIIGTRGRGERENDLIGSVTAKIIEDSKVPVLVIPEDSLYEGIATINVLYATNFDESDYIAIKKLMYTLSPFDFRLYCAHIGSEDTNLWDKAKMTGFKEKLTTHYPDYEIECSVIEDDDFLNGIQNIIREKRIDIISLVTHKRNLISKLFNPSIARKVLFHTNIPFLVFHADN